MLCLNCSKHSSYFTMLWSSPQVVSVAESPKMAWTRMQVHLCSPWDAHSLLLCRDLGRPRSQPFSQGQQCFFLQLPQKPEMNSSHTLESYLPGLLYLVKLQGLINSLQHLTWEQWNGKRVLLSIGRKRNLSVFNVFYQKPGSLKVFLAKAIFARLW